MRQKLVYMLVGIALVIGMIALPPAPAAQAGSNGQQLQIYVGCSHAPSLVGIKVEGYMWNNTWGTKEWSFTSSPVRSFTTWNYWWKSWNGKNVRVYYKYAGSNPNGFPYSWYANDIYVPPSQPSNVFPVNVNANQDCSKF